MITRGTGPVDEDYFYSLIKTGCEKKKRACVRCRVEFISKHKGHRVCGQCKERAHAVGARAEHVYKVPELLRMIRD